MAEERVQRRLAAILAADVVGYSRLMEADEAGTLSRLKAIRSDVFDPKTEAFGGRVFKNTGDGAMVEFASSVDAVQCAVEIQRTLAARDAEAPENRRLVLRIGISQGDVIVDDDDLFGNGVNVAARMEGLAEPGGICVSGNVREHIGNSLDVSLEDLGDQTVKNIDRPVRCYRVQLESDRTTEQQPPSLPDKPSIAVLPFENMSGDPEQEYFSDGITEDLITDLAKISGLFVVARNAAFLYKGKAVKPAEVSRELNVRYVLEGSVRRAGKRVRITAQLIDPLTGYHLWAERYDRDLTDIFALQDEITEKIVAALEVKLTAGEREQVERHYTENLEAYDYFLRSRAYDARSTRDANSRSREMFQRAIALDPNFAGAYAVLSHTHWRDWRNQWSDDPAVLQKAFEDASMAVALDGTLPIARTYLGWVCVFRQEYEKAVAEAEKAVRLDPGFAEGYARLAVILGFADKPKEAFEAIQNALRLDPHYPPSYDLYLGMACFALGKYDDAVMALKKSLTRNPEALGCNLWLSAALNILGRDDEANAQMAEVMRISPKATERDLRERSPFKNQALNNLYFTVLRKAGLPE